MIAIREASDDDMPLCDALQAVYTTDTVWQFMPGANPSGKRNPSGALLDAQGLPLLQFRLQQVRLPRKRTLRLPSAAVPLNDTWNDYTARLVAMVDTRLCGFVCLHLLPDQRQAIIARLLVESLLRRKGIGRALLRAALAWAGERGLVALTGHTPLRNVPGISFYQHCGFRFSGLIEHFYPTREDALLLARPV
jgi:GNAT superfamily N-acetyltransferase